MPAFVLVPSEPSDVNAESTESSRKDGQSSIWIPFFKTESDSCSFCRRFPPVPFCTLAALVGMLVVGSWHPSRIGISHGIELVGDGSCPAACGQSVACTSASKPEIPERPCPVFTSGGDEPGACSAVINLQGCNFDPGDEYETFWAVSVFQAPGDYFYEVTWGAELAESFPIENGTIDLGTADNLLTLQVYPGEGAEGCPGAGLDITSFAFLNDAILFYANVAEDSRPMFALQLLETLPVTPERRLSAARRLTAEDFFFCPDDCVISSLYVNDDFCDCPETCADEDSWTCATCGETPPPVTTPQPEEESQAYKNMATGVGVGVGVGGGLALGLGLGIGLGTGAGVGTGSTGSAAAAAAASVAAAFSSEGSLKLQVENPDILQTEAFTNAIKRSIARIAGSSVVAAMVELIIGCAAASRRLAPALRRLAETVEVCFKIGVEQESLAEEVCDTLSGYNAATVATVISSEILDSGIEPGQVEVIGYQPNPNPRANNPSLNTGGSPRTPFVPDAGGISLG